MTWRQGESLVSISMTGGFASRASRALPRVTALILSKICYVVAYDITAIASDNNVAIWITITCRSLALEGSNYFKPEPIGFRAIAGHMESALNSQVVIPCGQTA